MKIAIVNELANGGATRCARDLMTHLAQRHEVQYFPQSEDLSVNTLHDGLQKFNPDVVHCHSFFGSYPYKVLPSMVEKYPTCFTAHDPRPVGTLKATCWECARYQTCVRCPLSSRKRRYSLIFNKFFRQRLLKRMVHQRTDRRLVVVTPSEWLRQRLLATEMKRFHIEHIPNGVDLTHYAPQPAARQNLGFPENEKIILYIGRKSSSRRKGLPYLLDAFLNRIVPAIPNAVLLSVGEQPDVQHANIRAVEFTPQERLPSYYAAADVFVTPTLADNLPYTVIEAMGTGTPVVASDVGGIPEEVVDGVTGCLVPPADAPALAQAVTSILQSDDTRRAMGSESRKRVEQLYGMATFVQEYERLYERISCER